MVGTARKLAVCTVLGALVAAGCGSSTSKGATASGFVRITLAEGPWPNIAATPIYEAILDFPQPAGERAPLPSGHMHPPGFVVGLSGTTQVNLDDGSHITVGPGQVIFAPPFVHHNHENPGPNQDDWLFIGVRTETARDQPLPSPSAKLVFNETGDIPGVVPGSTYMLKLDQYTIRPGGQSAVQKQGGATLIYDFAGETSLHQQTLSPTVLDPGHTAFVPAAGVFQLHNPFKDQAQVLVMTFWQQGQSSDTPVGSASF